MSFSYDAAHLATSPLDQVRFRLGDTSETTARFQDEEINFALSLHDNDVRLACIDCVKALLPQLGNSKEFTVGPYTEREGSNALAYWTKVLDELTAEGTKYSAPLMMPPTGPHIFHYGMMQNHGAAD